jgi:hypothetical protein
MCFTGCGNRNAVKVVAGDYFRRELLTKSAKRMTKETPKADKAGLAMHRRSHGFTLIESASFDNTPVIILANFTLGATYVWNTNTGDFVVYVGNHAPVATNLNLGVQVGVQQTLQIISNPKYP